MKPVKPVSSDRSSFFAPILTIRHFLTSRCAAVLVGLGVVGALAVLPGLVLDADAEAAIPHAPVRALPVATTRPSPADGYARRRAFTGEVRARRSADLGFDRAARVVSVLVDEGDVVDEGRPLARLETQKLAAERARVAAARKEAEAVLAEMRAGPRASTVEAAREAAADLRAQEELLERKAERRRRLLATNTISDEEYDEVHTLLTSVRARLRGAEDRLAELEEGTRAEQIDAQRARVAQLEASLRRIDLDLEDATLTAPFAGRVLHRHLDEGGVATPGRPVITLVEDRRLEARIGVPPGVALRLEMGGSHAIHVGDVTFEARLLARLPATDERTRTQTVLFELPAEAVAQVVPGQVARLDLEERVPVSGFWLPTSALSRGVRGLWAVYGLEPTPDGDGLLAVRHPVEVLHTDGERAFVRGTLGAEDSVVVGNTERVAPGQRVKPADPELQVARKGE